MIQTRSGRCRQCGYVNEAEAIMCSECGAQLEWQDVDTPVAGEHVKFKNPRPPVGSRPSSRAGTEIPTRDPSLFRAAPKKSFANASFIRTVIISVVAVCAIFVVVSWRMGIALPFMPASKEIDIEVNHGAWVQDAETFRTATYKASQLPPTDPAYSPDSNYLVSINMPHGGDALEITVNSSWNLLDYATRLRYANNISKRWQDSHAPYRALVKLYDLSGRQVGGRDDFGVTSVNKSQNTVFDISLVLGRTTTDAQTILGPPQTSITPPITGDAAVDATAFGSMTWRKDGNTLQLNYAGNDGIVRSCLLTTDGLSAKTIDRDRLLEIGSLQDKALRYRVVFLHQPKRDKPVAMKVVLNPFEGRTPANPGPDTVSHTVVYKVKGRTARAQMVFQNADGNIARVDGTQPPWSKTLTVKGNPTLWLAADSEALALTPLTVEIAVDGKTVATATGSTPSVTVDLNKPAATP